MNGEIVGSTIRIYAWNHEISYAGLNEPWGLMKTQYTKIKDHSIHVSTALKRSHVMNPLVLMPY